LIKCGAEYVSLSNFLENVRRCSAANATCSDVGHPPIRRANSEIVSESPPIVPRTRASNVDRTISANLIQTTSKTSAI